METESSLGELFAMQVISFCSAVRLDSGSWDQVWGTTDAVMGYITAGDVSL